jgi:hypothetical protein
MKANNFLAMSFVAVLTAMPRAQSDDIQSGLVSYWTFDQTPSLIVADSADKNDGQSGAINWSPGRVGSALQFYGRPGLRVPDDETLRPAKLTHMAWVKPDTGVLCCNARDEVMTFFRDSGNWRGSVGLSLTQGGVPWFEFQNGSSSPVSLLSPESVVIGEWTLLAATYDGSWARLYVNGIETVRANYTGGIDYGLGPRAFDIGGDLWGVEFFHGLIDEVAVWNRALTEAEIQKCYQKGLRGAGLPVNGNRRTKP